MEIENCLGELKAQVDHLLFEGAFIDEVKGYNDATSERSIIIKGRKGSGKTAVARVIQKVNRDKGELCELLTPTTFSFLQFDRSYELTRAIPGFPADFALREIWSYIIYTTAMKAVLESKHVCNTAKLADLETIREYIKKHGLTGKRARAEYLPVFDTILATIRGSGPGPKKGPFEAIGDFVDGQIRDAAFEALSRIVDGLGIKLHLFIDETDQEWGDAGDRDAVIRLLTNLVEVIYLMNFDDLQKSLFPRNLRTKIFLRDEIYACGQFSNPRVLGARTVQLNWDRDSLFSMICARIGIATGHRGKDSYFVWETIFPRTLSVDPRHHAFDYLLSYTYYRPRDMIDLCQKCIIEASRQDREDRIRKVGERIVGRVSETDIKTVLKESCSTFVDYEIMEAKHVFPECKALLERFTGKPWSESPKYYVDEILKQACADLQLADTEEFLLEKLFNFGFFGANIKKPLQPPGGKALERIFWYDNINFNIMQADSLCVHRAFHRKCALGPSEDPLGEWVGDWS